jgi:hypothetical protein
LLGDPCIFDWTAQESVDAGLHEIYSSLLGLVNEQQLLKGEWPDNRSHLNLLA